MKRIAFVVLPMVLAAFTLLTPAAYSNDKPAAHKCATTACECCVTGCTCCEGGECTCKDADCKCCKDGKCDENKCAKACEKACDKHEKKGKK